MPTTATQQVKKSVKPSTQAVKSEREMTAGHQAIKFNPNQLTIVTKKHPLAEKLYLTRNDTVYEPGSASVEEFKRQGQLQPIGVFPYANPVSGEKELVVAFGVQRVLKAKAAGIPVEAVPFKDWTPEDAEQAMIAENEQRINLSFKDQLMAVRRLVKHHREAKTKNYFGYVASLFGRSSHQWARDMYAVSALPAEILKKVPDVIPFATAIQIAKAEPESENQTIAEAQKKVYDELMSDETNVSQKGTVRADRALSNRVQKTVVEKLSPAELRVIIANENVDLSLSDEDARIVIAAIIGDKDLNEVKRAGIGWYTHPAKVEKPKSGKAAKNARKEAAKKETQVSIDDLEFDGDDDDEDENEEE